MQGKFFIKLIYQNIKYYILSKIYVFKINLRKDIIVSFSVNLNKKTIFEGHNRIYEHVRFAGKIGRGSYIGSYARITANIGRFTSIAPYVHINCGQHPYKAPYVSTSPCFISLQEQCGFRLTEKQRFNELKNIVNIGNDCWIGQGVFISGGVTIGDGVVVLAHAAVVKDIPPYAIVGGVPAKIIGYRYDEETIQLLQKIQWWNYDMQWLKDNIEIMTDIEKLKNMAKNISQ